jgi:hypothetical protein
VTQTSSPSSLAQKPRSLTDAEWTSILRAQRCGVVRFVISSRTFLQPLLATLCGFYFAHLQRSEWNPIAALHSALEAGLGATLVLISLFSTVLGVIDWFGKRRTARVAGL